jgi:hypothetical protein
MRLVWHNGVTLMPKWARAFPTYQFYSINIVEDGYGHAGGWPHGFEDWQWNPSWVQLLGDNNGLAIECRDQTDLSPRVRPLSTTGEWGTQPGNGPEQVVSLCTPVTWWIESLRANEYRWQSDARGWDWDFQKPYDRPEKRAYI